MLWVLDAVVSEYHQLCFDCGDAETLVSKPVVHSNNCFMGDSVLSGYFRFRGGC